MGNINQINTKNRTYYFFDDITNIKNFNSNLLKTDKDYKYYTYINIDIYYINYITMKNHLNINCVNPFYLVFNKIDGYTEEKNGNKYLINT